MKKAATLLFMAALPAVLANKQCAKFSSYWPAENNPAVENMTPDKVIAAPALGANTLWNVDWGVKKYGGQLILSTMGITFKKDDVKTTIKESTTGSEEVKLSNKDIGGAVTGWRGYSVDTSNGKFVSGFKLKMANDQTVSIGVTPDSADELVAYDGEFWGTLTGAPGEKFKYSNTDWYPLEELIGFGSYQKNGFERMYFIDNNCTIAKQTQEAKDKLAEDAAQQNALGGAVDKMKDIVTNGAAALKEKEAADKALKAQVLAQAAKLTNLPEQEQKLAAEVAKVKRDADEVELLIMAITQEIKETKILLVQQEEEKKEVKTEVGLIKEEKKEEEKVKEQVDPVDAACAASDSDEDPELEGDDAVDTPDVAEVMADAKVVEQSDDKKAEEIVAAATPDASAVAVAKAEGETAKAEAAAAAVVTGDEVATVEATAAEGDEDDDNVMKELDALATEAAEEATSDATGKDAAVAE